MIENSNQQYGKAAVGQKILPHSRFAESRIAENMKFNIITIFPNLFDSFLNESLVKKAIEKGVLEFNVINLRDLTTDKHKTTDDTPYGGGAGMVMKVEPIYKALESIKATPNFDKDDSKKTLLLSAKGKQFDQTKSEKLSKLEEITLVCGRYEGVDERVAQNLVDEEVSIGKYILNGGEVPAMVVIEAVARLVPGFVGNAESLKEESFAKACPTKPAGRSREHPQYTKPEEFNDWKVPEVLLSGDHQKIKQWRTKKT